MEKTYTINMFETMMHMIGYGNLEENFIDAIDSCELESLLELAEICDERWGTDCLTGLKERIARMEE